MSDSKSSYGEPVEEPRAVDDVVGSAHEGIADAEAAGRNAVVSDEPSGYESRTVEPARDSAPAADPSFTEPRATGSFTRDPEVDDDPAFDSALYEAHAEDSSTSTTSYPTTVAPVTPVETATTAYPQTVTPAETSPAITPSDPAAETSVVAPATGAAATGTAAYGASGYGQPIFVQAPEAPRPRGNRGAAGAIGLLAALSFGVLYLAVWIGFGLLNGDVTVDTIASTAAGALATWSLWVPIVVFFIAFWLLGAIINRGRWGAWVIFGLLVGVASYVGHILGALFQAPFWMLTTSQGAALVEAQLLSPLAIAAFIIGRELTIWYGAWVASRGARVTELNIEAQREYERTLEAGPQLTRV